VAQEANKDMGVEDVQATAVEEGRAADDVLLDRFNPGRVTAVMSGPYVLKPIKTISQL